MNLRGWWQKAFFYSIRRNDPLGRDVTKVDFDFHFHTPVFGALGLKNRRPSEVEEEEIDIENTLFASRAETSLKNTLIPSAENNKKGPPRSIDRPKVRERK